MYPQPVHAELHIPTLRNFIKKNPLGVLTTAFRHPSSPLIQCSHLPFVLDVENESSETELGVLRGHLARANPHAKMLIEAAKGRPRRPIEVVVFFNGPHHYTKAQFLHRHETATGKVVPTRNYAALQAYGKATGTTSGTPPMAADLTRLSRICLAVPTGFVRSTLRILRQDLRDVIRPVQDRKRHAGRDIPPLFPAAGHGREVTATAREPRPRGGYSVLW